MAFVEDFLQTIVEVGWGTSGWFVLSFQAQWENTSGYTDTPLITPTGFDAFVLNTAASNLPSIKKPVATVVKPYTKSNSIVLTLHGTNVTQESIFGALARGEGYLFGGTFTGANNAECFQNALTAFANSAVSRGFFPDIPTAEASLYLQSGNDINGPGWDVNLIATTYTYTENGNDTTFNGLMLMNIGLAKTFLNPNANSVYPFTLDIASGQNLNGYYKWTANGRTFKQKPLMTVDNFGVPLNSWWTQYEAEAAPTSLPSGQAGQTTLHWRINTRTLAITVS